MCVYCVCMHKCAQVYVSKHMWGAVAISVAMSFGAFLITFAGVAVGMALESIGDKIGELMSW